MRRFWPAVLLLGVFGCKERPAPAVKAEPFTGRAVATNPALPGPIAAPQAPAGVVLPSRLEGYVGLRPDDAAVAYGVSQPPSLRAVDGRGRELFTTSLEGQAALIRARSYLVDQGFQPLTDHPPDPYLELEVRPSIEGHKVVTRLGDRRLEVALPQGTSVASRAELAGWARDGRALVLRLEGSEKGAPALLGYAIVPVPVPP